MNMNIIQTKKAEKPKWTISKNDWFLNIDNGNGPAASLDISAGFTYADAQLICDRMNERDGEKALTVGRIGIGDLFVANGKVYLKSDGTGAWDLIAGIKVFWKGHEAASAIGPIHAIIVGDGEVEGRWVVHGRYVARMNYVGIDAANQPQAEKVKAALNLYEAVRGEKGGD